MTLVWDSPFPTPTAKLIALKLADCANDDGANVFPSRRTVERATMCSPAAVKKWLAAFEQAGLLIVERRSAGGPQKDTTVRRFNMTMLRALASGTKRFDHPTTGLAIVDAVDLTGGHVVAGPWDDPATTYPAPGHRVADTRPRNGPNPSKNRQRTVNTPLPPHAGGKSSDGFSGSMSGPTVEALRALAADRPRDPVVERVLMPLLAQKRFSATDPAAALAQACACAKGLPAAHLDKVLEILLAADVKVIKSDRLLAAIDAVRKGGLMLVIRRGEPEFTAWLQHYEQTQPALAQLMERTGKWQVPARIPPTERTAA